MLTLRSTLLLLLLFITSHQLSAAILGFGFAARGSLDLALSRGEGDDNNQALAFDRYLVPRGGGNIAFDLYFKNKPESYHYFSLTSSAAFHLFRTATAVVQNSTIRSQWHEFSLDIGVKYHVLLLTYISANVGMVFNTKANFFSANTQLTAPRSTWTLHPLLSLELGGNIPLGSSFADRYYYTYLNIAVRASLNPMILNPARGAFGTPASFSLLLGVNIAPAVIG